MAVTKEQLKKHHFWILSGLAPLLVIGAVLMMWTEAGAEVEKKDKLWKDKLKEFTGTNPKGKKVLALLDGQKKQLDDKKYELWKDNWNRQFVTEHLFDWPRSNDPLQRLRKLEDKYVKFAEPMQDPESQFEVLKQKEVYEAAYNQAAAAIAPTGFPAGGWRRVFRHVAAWGDRKPTSEQVWLALEDLWVQRAMILPVRTVNNTAAKFEPVPPAAGQPADPFKRSFRSRVWQLDLEIPTDGPDGLKVIRARLTNLTNQLQLLGVGNTMRLRVWLSDMANAQPIDFRIEGEFVRAGESKDVPLVRRLHTIPPGYEVQKLARVEQVLDSRTVPVREVMNVELGYLDSRNAAAPLKVIDKIPELAAAPGAAPGAPGPPGRPPGPGAEVAGPSGPGGATGRIKAGTPATVLDANRKRYFDVTNQVRRMPVAIVLLIDQMFMQDALVAYSNSPLRVQITQFHWRRYRGALPGAGGTPEGLPVAAGPGFDGPGGLPPAGFGLPGQFPGASTGLTTVSEGQVTSGLVELTIYGIVSLYEKYEPPATTTPADGAPPADGSTATPADAAVPAPQPKDADKPADPGAAPAATEKPAAEKPAAAPVPLTAPGDPPLPAKPPGPPTKE